MSDPDVLIVGGGIAGLCCARRLHEAGLSCQVLEAGKRVGGRAQTDELDGFLLDRGFQVLLTAYPEAQHVLDYTELQLARFEPGALIRWRGKFHRFADPWRRPRHLLATAFSPVATLADKLRVARLRGRVCRGTLEQLFDRPETTTLAALRRQGFSERIVERFFRPFLGGVFLDGKLTTSSRMFEFVFRMFSQGDAAVPSGGMGELAKQIAGSLPAAAVKTGAEVQAVEGNSLRLAGGEHRRAAAVVVACEGPAAARLLGDPVPADRAASGGQGVSCLYFAADRPPLQEPILVLNGDGQGPINNLCVPSQVAPAYAPAGQSLVSVTVLGAGHDEAVLEEQVRSQLHDWFGAKADHWRHLRTYRIPYALPSQAPPALSPVAKLAKRRDGVFVCGDYLDTASLQGAMVSGRRAAELIIRQRQG